MTVHRSSNLAATLLIGISYAHPVSQAGFSAEISLEGFLDDAVIYTNLFDFPSSAVHVDNAGGLWVGDPIGVTNVLEVSDDGEVSLGGLTGFFRNHTFGNRDIAVDSRVDLVRNGQYLTGGQFVSGVDVIQIFWLSFDDGINGHGLGAGPLMVVLSFWGDAGSLVNTQGRLMPQNTEELSDLVLGAHVQMSWPNAFSHDAFATNPTYTITPAPGVLAALGLGGLIAARRRRHTAKEPA